MDKQYMKAYEEVNVRNAKAVVEYNKQTRQIVRDLQDRVALYEKQVQQQSIAIDQLRKQVQQILVSSYTKGPTS
jgi:predicted DNA-binding protein YlxM (UPF0122 family)